MGLMDNCTTYDTLRKKYNDFLIPAVKLNIGGVSLLEQNGIFVEEIEIKLSLKHAGSVSFTIHSQYDYEQHSFSTVLKEKVIPGKVIEVSLGYSSTTTTVFKGFIASIDVHMDVEQGIYFTITALDARQLMMTDNKPYILHHKKKYSEIVTDIMKRYQNLCKLYCDATEETLTTAVCQRESDFDFIVKKLTDISNREFFIVNDTAYFRKPQSVTAPILTLGIGKGLKTVQRSFVYLQKEFEVHGYYIDQQKKVIAKKTAKSKDNQSTVIPAGTTVIVAPHCETNAQATKIAESYVEQELQKNTVVFGSCVGLPELIPGRYIKIEDIDTLINKNYYITEVSHSINTNGFVTQFQTEG